MFGVFKRVSVLEQQMLTNLALEVIEKIDDMHATNQFYSSLPDDKRAALEKYRNAALQCLQYGESDDVSDNMSKMIWNAAFKQLSAASKIMEQTKNILEKKL